MGPYGFGNPVQGDQDVFVLRLDMLGDADLRRQLLRVPAAGEDGQLPDQLIGFFHGEEGGGGHSVDQDSGFRLFPVHAVVIILRRNAVARFHINFKPVLLQLRRFPADGAGIRCLQMIS